ncbi:hypothetical protein L228DRAFT_223167 [Xylona heveae TC161]|uniref:Zn(2)-C6 fungal-type domain-containing protein n=1 Tax=Xylona heveae (strain CBS 132557 / TC161) TaxID=1328760 RepID=A0A165AAD6_XYLHT|nr:hypothetical protein L228DRAFT_223167 [Xylona heveae TC161]KZF20168.1 hypothetical protein L228DRAFT_223167 [Xylona heveae TC161]
MFTTFAAAPAPHRRRHRQDGRRRRSRSLSSSSDSPRPRKQVARACDLCRLSRVRCDGQQPCQTCLRKQYQCVYDESRNVRTLADAMKVIDSLRAETKFLKEQLSPAANRQSQTNRGISRQEGFSHIPQQSGALHNSQARRRSTSPLRLDTHPRSPFCTSDFADRLEAFLQDALEEECHPVIDTFTPASLELASFRTNHAFFSAWDPGPPRGADWALSRPQEEFYLSLFWQAHHCLAPIVNESEFKELFEALWSYPMNAGTRRHPSPLVDIVMALCIQWGANFIESPDHQKVATEAEDTSFSGSQYYRRCMCILVQDLESPSLSTVQCYIYAVIYLSNATLLSMSYNLLGLGFRVAYSIGLHDETSLSESAPDRQLRRRIWWTLVFLDTIISLQLSRPAAAENSHIPFPSDDEDTAQAAGPNFSSLSKDQTWLNYHVQLTKAVTIGKTIYDNFLEHHTKTLQYNHVDAIDDDPATRELCAKYLTAIVRPLHAWRSEVSPHLVNSRRASGKPFSTDRTMLELDGTLPLWQQRQRILLELFYHNMLNTLHRPFINLSPSRTRTTKTPITAPVADGHAITCLNHAVTMTMILHQVLTETDILNGWYDLLYHQWSAMQSLLAFIIAYPACPPTPTAWKFAKVAIDCFDILGEKCTLATRAAGISRSVISKAKRRSEIFRSRITSSESRPNAVAASTSQSHPPSFLSPPDEPRISNGFNGLLSPTDLALFNERESSWNSDAWSTVEISHTGFGLDDPSNISGAL